MGFIATYVPVELAPINLQRFYHNLLRAVRHLQATGPRPPITDFAFSISYTMLRFESRNGVELPWEWVYNFIDNFWDNVRLGRTMKLVADFINPERVLEAMVSL